MCSEPAATGRPGGAPGARKRGKQAKPDRKAQVTAELRAMMRDVPISERLLQVLDEIDEAAAADGARPPQGAARDDD